MSQCHKKLGSVARKIIFMYFCLSHLTLAGLWCRCGQSDGVWYLKTDVGAGSFCFAACVGDNPFPQTFGRNTALFLSQNVQQKVKVLCQAGATAMQGDRDAWKASAVGLSSPSPYTRASPRELLSQQAEWLCCSVLWLPAAAGGRICPLLPREGAVWLAPLGIIADDRILSSQWKFHWS